ncbi:uncharacterized protein LOC119076575 [Bradysia coprophila]|uniref:uncharacterized protein LOC119076575 n=1 Tax=Bradysia coprophila TaxID=38358 RepID=UPI00187DC3D5|nr:uncharacterized protein LOC119076575 [Bradysia coprophila]
MFGYIVGVDFKFEWKNNLRFVVTKSLVFFFWTQVFYTHYVYSVYDNFVRNFEVFAIYGITVSAVLKIRCFDSYYLNITAMFKSSLKIYKQNGDARGKPFTDRLTANFNLYKFVASMAIFITILYMYYPVKSFLIDGEMVQFVPIEFMFVDQSTLLGFLVASGIMGTLGVYAIFGTEYMALTFVAIVMNYGPRVDILNENFDELDKMWLTNSSSAAEYKHSFLVNICRKYADMREYINEVKLIFDQKLYIFFVFAYLSQILCLYQIRVNNWIPGYALAIGFSIEMIFYCLMGTKLTVENERFCQIITQSSWYTYDQWSQKMILMLLGEAMNFSELRIGPFAPLSVYTATEIFKSIYSYYTLMMEVM